MAQEFESKAKANKPSKPLLTASAKGLLEAAKGIGGVVPTALEISQQADCGVYRYAILPLPCSIQRGSGA